MADQDPPAGGTTGGVITFDKAEYDKLREVVQEVARTTSDALWDSNGYSIGPDLRAQPAQATWSIASQVGSSVNKLASQVRTHTDTLCSKALPEFSESVAKAVKVLEETDGTATADANS